MGHFVKKFLSISRQEQQSIKPRTELSQWEALWDFAGHRPIKLALGRVSGGWRSQKVGVLVLALLPPSSAITDRAAFFISETRSWIKWSLRFFLMPNPLIMWLICNLLKTNRAVLINPSTINYASAPTLPPTPIHFKCLDIGQWDHCAKRYFGWLPSIIFSVVDERARPSSSHHGKVTSKTERLTNFALRKIKVFFVSGQSFS